MAALKYINVKDLSVRFTAEKKFQFKTEIILRDSEGTENFVVTKKNSFRAVYYLKSLDDPDQYYVTIRQVGMFDFWIYQGKYTEKENEIILY